MGRGSSSKNTQVCSLGKMLLFVSTVWYREGNPKTQQLSCRWRICKIWQLACFVVATACAFHDKKARSHHYYLARIWATGTLEADKGVTWKHTIRPSRTLSIGTTFVNSLGAKQKRQQAAGIDRVGDLDENTGPAHYV